MLDLSLKLLCSNKSGTLSRLIRELRQVGMQYQSHKIDSNGKHTHMSIEAVGELNCSRENLEQILDGFSEVLQVQELSLSQNGKEITEFKTQVSETHIADAEHLTPAVLLAAEKRLSEILGPVASLIVENVKDQCADAGELYARLAEELNDDSERRQFLSILDRK